MKKVNSEGKVTYYYYKKKKGRHKKRGPKPKHTLKKREKSFLEWKYKIVLCKNKKQIKYIGKYKTLDELYKEKEKLLEANKKVVFPQEFSNSSKLSKSKECKYEYLLLKSVPSGETESQLQNEYGKYVSVNTTSEKWSIMERFDALFEETFWVYGYSPNSDRKTIEWILNILIINLSEGSVLLRMYLYGNKICIINDDKDLEIIICKSKTDAIRVYNYIEENSAISLISNGDVSQNYKLKQEIIEMIHEKTNWCKNKIYK